MMTRGSNTTKCVSKFFFFKQKTAYEIASCLVGSEMCIRDSPGTGSEQERGKFNNIFNIPLPAGISSEEYLNVFDRVLKKLEEFRPEFILISAGFDAHEDDPLAQFNLKTEDYFIITKRVLETSKKFCSGKVVSILEGGYDLNALRDSTKRHVDALLEFN